jgi:hypothetical protein
LVFVVVIVEHVELAIVLEELATMLNLVLSEERSDDSIVVGEVREWDGTVSYLDDLDGIFINDEVTNGAEWFGSEFATVLTFGWPLIAL